MSNFGLGLRAKCSTSKAFCQEVARVLNVFSKGQDQLPDFRSEKGWKNILDTFYESCENRLKDFHTSPDIFAFATKCFKDLDFKEKFVAQAVEICTRHAIPFEVQTSFVHATAGTADFEKSAQAAAGLFNYSLASGNRSIDLESEEPASSSFQVALRPSDQVLDLE